MLRSALCILLLGFTAIGSAAAADRPPLTFAAKDIGEPRSGATIELWRPAARGPVPAMLVLHGCGGVDELDRTWAARLVGWGYAAAIVDSFRPRHVMSECVPGTVTPQVRAQDAFNAAIYLRSRPDILPDSIGVMGHSHGGSTTLWTVNGSEVPVGRGGRPFAVAVAYYPGCGASLPKKPPVTDVLILIGKDDDWTPADACRKWVAETPGPAHAPTMKVYPGAVHGFDRGSLPTVSFGHLIGRNTEAAEDSFSMTQAFLAARLKSK